MFAISLAISNSTLTKPHSDLRFTSFALVTIGNARLELPLISENQEDQAEHNLCDARGYFIRI
jgi:hypothetical protein